MLKITITVEDEDIEYMNKAETTLFETAEMHLGALSRNYEKRVAMEMREPETI